MNNPFIKYHLLALSCLKASHGDGSSTHHSGTRSTPSPSVTVPDQGNIDVVRRGNFGDYDLISHEISAALWHQELTLAFWEHIFWRVLFCWKGETRGYKAKDEEGNDGLHDIGVGAVCLGR